MRPETIDLPGKLASFDELWSPRIVAELNGQHIKLAKLDGAFVWHSHAEEDEMFLVLKGMLTIELRDGAVVLGPGQMTVVPRGVEHRPVADGEVHLLLFEPAGTLNTGNVRNERTVEELERI